MTDLAITEPNGLPVEGMQGVHIIHSHIALHKIGAAAILQTSDQR